jgi:ABC-2 type transport system ATP-binding protein
MFLIQASHLSKTYGSHLALHDFSVQVSAGEIYGLVGPDGAGKTTALRLLCGALRPDPGGGEARPTLSIANLDMLKHTEQARVNVGYLPQRFSLYEELTVLENLRFFAEVRGLPAREWQPRCMEILAFVGMDEFVGRRAGQLSGGMRQKLGLAAALVHRPAVLLLDEPTTGVDPVTRQDFWQLIIRLVGDEGVAALISTPYMDEASRCTRLGFLRQGSLLIEDIPENLLKRLDGRIIELLGEPLPLLRKLARADPQVQDAQLFGDRLHLRVDQGSASGVIERLGQVIPTRGGLVRQMRPLPPQLEDVFIDLLENGA